MQAGADPVITNPTEALDKLGPKGPIAEKVGPIDAGKGPAPAQEFWAEVLQMFNPGTGGLPQVMSALDKLEKKKKTQLGAPTGKRVQIMGITHFHYKNGQIVDGTGNPWFHGDLAIKGDRIIAIGRLPNSKPRYRSSAAAT